MLVNVLYLQEAHYIFQERTFLLGRKNILITEVSQLANMLLISNKISINKNKQIYFFYFFFIFLY